MYVGSYFNVVKNTQITDELVSFEDLIIDILVLPSGEYFILDEDELPESLEEFEDGYVNEALHVLEEIIQKDPSSNDCRNRKSEVKLKL